ncbi:Acetylornithine deacetylase/Succinyl-diaminopimelate desuccinylase [Sphingomonas sp. NFR04]|uniref:M20/M25/M40 family metallo-hydrolase n=1 Tax=Sphingomonas sp. NFR04 TaxID=1566283 RepID=UPI0008E1BA21|nr:M20/M25/M40 family metallo-hydrolase [Sphingomonas sp. NFR04]SFJ80098.1 Acetylornithine deacetylase/Succinyl-diaminopimelate desuccinylase [Sphingomonas sp. NFR04]
MKKLLATAALAVAIAAPAAAQTRPDQAKFFELYKELVETNTVVNVGSCTQAAEQIAARMKAAGFKDDQLTLFSTPEHPKDGGLVAVYPGTSKKAKPLLLLAHIDVVAAKREDWTRDPFKLVEENGYYYARGTADDKAMAAAWADTLIRFQQAGYKPKRTVKLALTCGEETTWAFNGAEWLAKNKRDLIDAEFALNEGGGGKSDGHGKVLVQSMQVGEKAVQNFRLETSNPGGHSSIPVPENAIYELADALVKIRGYDFPLELSDTTRAYFAKAGAARSDAMGKAMVTIATNPGDKGAETLLNTDRIYHSMLRTTCVATLLEGGHANNALPQRAAANINCRIFPGHSSEEIQKALATAIGDAKVTITMVPPVRPIAKPPALDPKVVGPAEKLVAKYFPGVPLVPTMSTGATDGIFLAAVGIPTYGVPGAWGDPDGNGVHGLNERIEVRSLYTGRDYLFDLVKAYAEQE